MKRTLVMFSFLTFYVFSVFAQEGYIKSYNFNYPSPTFFHAMIEDDSELVICGFLKDNIFPYPQGIFFTKMDTLGNILTFDTYYDSSGCYYAPGTNDGAGGLILLQVIRINPILKISAVTELSSYTNATDW